MPKLAECFSAVVGHAREQLKPRQLVIGGHSMGGRAASMMAADDYSCDGLLLLSYPLHPAGQPEKLRDAHLINVHVPTLCMNGTRDELCTKELMDAVVAKMPSSFTMHWITDADHSYNVLKRSGRTKDDELAEIGQTAAEWVR